MTKGVFIFRRDLRTNDNLALKKICESCDKVVCIFIFSEEQIDKRKNPFFGNASFQFMIESLEDLAKQLSHKITFLKGDCVEILKDIRKHWKFQTIAFNEDYTPYARKRDQKIKDWCDSVDVECMTESDYTLHNLVKIRTQQGDIYQMFTPFYRTASALPVAKPNRSKSKNIVPFSANNMPKTTLKEISKGYSFNEKIVVKGGRQLALMRLEDSTTNYVRSRENVQEQTTLMGAYIKFGCVSIREAHEVFKGVELLRRQLYWKEFYAYVAYHTPEVLSKSRNYNAAMTVRWVTSEDLFRKWCEGRTGYPMVDAGMRQMNAIGWMHNRARMITASFLVKHLGIDWRKGERYFATKLVDYDPCNNNGGWQWSASTGTDAQPYFRIFNPWTQNKNHDPECIYVRRWIPELNKVPIKHILRWSEHYKDHPETQYPEPVVEHETARKASLARFKGSI